MTLAEHNRKLNKEIEDRNYKKVVTLITSIFYCDYRKDNRKWHIKKICEETKLSRPTVRKMINKYESSYCDINDLINEVLLETMNSEIDKG